ncbi:wax ester/triacylglycerol synthase family O-acyltransferase [Zhongshania sp.]|uniref:WS/DGAT/MGAT family O-acyltransferase n=1 Tax=Zhongshania sp. TaxID=1971902 RepID=UPI003567E18F
MKKLYMIDDSFLRLESRRQPLHIGMLMLFEPPEDATENFASDLAEKLRQSVKTAAPFNRLLVRKRGMHYWEEDSDFDLGHHFAHVSLPEPGRIRELLAMVSRLHCGHLDRSYPMWRIYLIEGIEDGRIAVYMKIHHSMVDGMTGIKMMINSMSPDRDASRDLPPFWEVETIKSSGGQVLPVPTPIVESIFAARKITRDSAKSMMGVARELRDSFVDYWRDNPDLAVAGTAPHTVFNQKVSGTRRFSAQSYSTPRIKTVAAALGGSSNDVILAMCAGALLRYLQELGEAPELPLSAAVPVSVRDRNNDTSDVANEVAFTIANLATNVADPVERLKAIKSSMDYNKERIRRLTPNQLQAYSAMMLMPGAMAMLLGRGSEKALASVVISHVPGPRQDLYWQGAKLSGLYPASLVIDQGALNITIISRHDTVDIGLIACRKAVPHMQRLLDYLEDSLSELEAAVAKLPKVELATYDSVNPKAVKPKAVKANAARSSKAKSVSGKPATESAGTSSKVSRKKSAASAGLTK